MTEPLRIFYGGHSWPCLTVAPHDRWTIVMDFSPGSGTVPDAEARPTYARTYEAVYRLVRHFPEPPPGPWETWDRIRRRRCLRDIQASLRERVSEESSRVSFGTCPHRGFLPPTPTVFLSSLRFPDCTTCIHLALDLDFEECLRLYEVHCVMRS